VITVSGIYLRKDVNMIERVQRRMTRMVNECRGKKYEEISKVIHLTTLEIRAERAYLLQVYKIMMGIERVKEDFFQYVQ